MVDAAYSDYVAAGQTLWTLHVSPSAGLATVVLSETASEGQSLAQLVTYTLEGSTTQHAISGSGGQLVGSASLSGKVTSITAWVFGTYAAAVLTWFPQ
jgi:hypothetical protein